MMMSSVSFYINVATLAAIKGRQQEGNLGEKTAFPSTSAFLPTLEKQKQRKKQKAVNDTLAVYHNLKC